MNHYLLAALQAAGATSDSLSSAWVQAVQAQGEPSGKLVHFLRSQGYVGSLNDCLFAYLGDKGYTGTLSDRLLAAAVALDVLVQPFDMNTLFTASQYGDFARVEDGVPLSSGGLLTRWTGLRTSGNANMRFDFMPYTNAPTVGPYGPAGENCIRFTGTADEYFVSSADRGGAANLVIPVGPRSDEANTTGFTAIARYKLAATGNPQYFINAYYGWTPFAYQSLQDITGSIYFKPQGISNALQSSTTVGAWVTVGMRRNKDGTASLYVDDGTTAVSTTTGLANASMEQWFSASRAGTGVTDVAGYLYGHVELTDEQFANAFNWIAGN